MCLVGRHTCVIKLSLSLYCWFAHHNIEPNYLRFFGGCHLLLLHYSYYMCGHSLACCTLASPSDTGGLYLFIFPPSLHTYLKKATFSTHPSLPWNGWICSQPITMSGRSRNLLYTLVIKIKSESERTIAYRLWWCTTDCAGYCPRCLVSRLRILVQVTIYRRLLIGRDGHLDQSEAYDISQRVREYGPRLLGLQTFQGGSFNNLNAFCASKLYLKDKANVFESGIAWYISS